MAMEDRVNRKLQQMVGALNQMMRGRRKVYVIYSVETDEYEERVEIPQIDRAFASKELAEKALRDEQEQLEANPAYDPEDDVCEYKILEIPLVES
jgi:hypothetical protein